MLTEEVINSHTYEVDQLVLMFEDRWNYLQNLSVLHSIFFFKIQNFTFINSLVMIYTTRGHGRRLRSMYGSLQSSCNRWRILNPLYTPEFSRQRFPKEGQNIPTSGKVKATIFLTILLVKWKTSRSSTHLPKIKAPFCHGNALFQLELPNIIRIPLGIPAAYSVLARPGSQQLLVVI